MRELNIKLVKNILGQSGGAVNMILDNVAYNCSKSMPMQEQMANLLTGQKGGKKKSSKKKNKSSKKRNKSTNKSEKTLYKEYLNKKYSKEQLLKKCKALGIKVTTRKNGMLKPIKKETLINKIVKIKFN